MHPENKLRDGVEIEPKYCGRERSSRKGGKWGPVNLEAEVRC